MSKYTTEVRFICEQASGLTESKGYNDINSIIDLAIPKVFNFDFPIFDENYRSVLERKILKHFYTREICEETVGLWKLRLDTRLNEIMPYYNKLYNSELLDFNPLYSDNLVRTRNTNLDSNRKTNSSGKTISNNSTQGSGNRNTINNSSDLFSDTPQGSIVGLDENTYLTNARKTTDNSSTTTTTSNNSSGTIDSSDNGSDNLKSTEEYLESVSGWSGVTGSELIMKYRETFINIDVMILNELEDLFFQLW